MQIGVLSDTHIPDRATEIPKEILDKFSDADMVLHAGDLVAISVLEKLKSVCKDIRAVWGNMDPYEVRQKLPEKEIISVGSYRIGLIHGYGNPNNLIELMNKIFKEDEVNIVVFGHSHYPVNQMKNNILYFNPGSPTDKIFSPYNSYGIIEINDTVQAKIIKI